jgi:Protein of unknown function (DUF2867)
LRRRARAKDFSASCTASRTKLLELINRTAHAAALSALVETTNAYRFYFGVYARSVTRFTPIYMALIDPFRRLVVYPSLLRTIRAKWNKTFGTD